jgi:hypothetical protein
MALSSGAGDGIMEEKMISLQSLATSKLLAKINFAISVDIRMCRYTEEDKVRARACHSSLLQV